MPIRSTELITGVVVMGIISFCVYRFLQDEKEEKLVECRGKNGVSYKDRAKAELIALRSKLEMKVKLKAHWDKEDVDEGTTVKRFYFIRHGEAEHNQVKKKSKIDCDCSTTTPSGKCPYLNFKTIDPLLTKLGRTQAMNLAPETTKNLAPDIIYVSPLRRATETATLAFAHLWPPTCSEKIELPKWKCDERIRERNGVHPCDRRLTVQALSRKFLDVDYHGLADQDIEWHKDIRERRLDAAMRGYKFMVDVMKRPEKTVAVVTHSSFMGGLFMSVLDCEDESLANWFKTGEMRAVTVSCKTASL